jgi:hypothetical protein
VELNHCAACGQATPPRAAFCPTCGRPIRPAAAGPVGQPIQPAPRKGPNGFLVGCGSIIGTLIVLFLIGSCISSWKETPSQPASDAGLHPGESRAAQSAPAPAPRPHVVLKESGSGIQTTRKFYVSEDWDLVWQYDCSSFGTSGNFGVYIDGGDGMDAGPNELGAKGDGTDHLHHGGGYRYLVVNSECDWTVEVISL